MNVLKILTVTLLVTIFLIIGPSYSLSKTTVQESGEKKTSEVTQEEISWTVPALKDLHSAVYPLWHTAFPEKDYELIKELLPQLDSLTSKLDEAPLPGILRDKREAWDKGKENLKSALQKLHKAVESDDKEEMLNQTEAFHSGFERLVRVIRPVVPELEAFHQELYKLYHYYMPNSQMDKIRVAISAMEEKLQPLKQAELPKRLAVRSEEFSHAVKELESNLVSLAEIISQDDLRAIEEAVEKVHTAYQKVEMIFD